MSTLSFSKAHSNRSSGSADRRGAFPPRMARLLFTFWLCVWLSGLTPLAMAQMQGIASAGREETPARPLPKGVTPPRVEYRDIAREAGIVDPKPVGALEKTYLVETTGTGVALFDFDDDGLVDVFFVGPGRFDRRGDETAHTLYRNLGNLRFEDVSENSGLVSRGLGQGVCAGDMDDDGLTDLFVTHWGRDALFRNLGRGAFADETADRGLAGVVGRRWGSGCAFLDFDRDGDLDLFVAHYVDFDPEATPQPGEAPQCRWKNVPIPCGPRGLPAESMSLFENDGSGRFADVSNRSGVAVAPNFYGLGVLTADFDDDGWTDIYVACDSTASLLFRNKRDGTFEDVGLLSGAAYNEDGQEQAGMGVTAADYDGDGLLDIFKTNFASDTNTLYRNEGDWIFSDETFAAGLGVSTRYVGWGTAFLDFDHDGWQDAIVVNGHVASSVDGTSINETYRQPALLFWNLANGAFHELTRSAGEALSTPHSARGLAVGDLDNDGTEEIVVSNLDEPPVLLKNYAPTQNWLRVRVVTASGRDAIGARVRVTAGDRTQIREVRSGGGYISQSDMRLHFGLGAESGADVAVQWPSGEATEKSDVEAGQQILIRPPATTDPE